MSRGYACIGLNHPKHNSNIGNTLRAVGVYKAAMLAISGKRYKKVSTDTMKQYRHCPLLQVDDLRSVIPYDCVPVAVDIIEGAIPLYNYTHPERAFLYIWAGRLHSRGKDFIFLQRCDIYTYRKMYEFSCYS